MKTKVTALCENNRRKIIQTLGTMDRPLTTHSFLFLHDYDRFRRYWYCGMHILVVLGGKGYPESGISALDL